jgi:DNA modification methylase
MSKKMPPLVGRAKSLSGLTPGLEEQTTYCGDNLVKLRTFPPACVDLIYIDPPFYSNRNYEVFWGETKESQSFDGR